MDNPNSLNRLMSQTTSATVEARLLNSASAELLETVDYFFDFQEISESPIFTAYPLTDFLVVRHEPQSPSQ